MPRVRLLHWRASEAAAHTELLRAAGHLVEYCEEFHSALMKNWRESPPDAFVIDLSRLPSHGREIAIALRQSRATRQCPIVFCGGAEEKVKRIRRELPDAVYCSLPRLTPAVRKAIAQRPANPVKPVQMMDRYGSRSAAQKLGIKAASVVAVIDPPRDLGTLLGELPPGVDFVEEAGGESAVTFCFIHEASLLAPTLSRVRDLAATSKLWIFWRKGASVKTGGVTERSVRERGIDLGLVDYKICSVNHIWSAMLFAVRRSK